MRTIREAVSGLSPSQLYEIGLMTQSTRLRDCVVGTVTTGLVQSWDDLSHYATRLMSGDLDSERHWLRFDPVGLCSLARLAISQCQSTSDLQDAVAIYQAVLKTTGASLLTTEDRLSLCEAFSTLGRNDELVSAISEFDLIRIRPLQAAVMLANRVNSRSQPGVKQWLEHVNLLYEQDEVSTVMLDEGELPVLDRLSCDAVPGSVDGPLVTVIIPTHDPGPEIFTSVRSIIAQTWLNLEILVMDDGSAAEFIPRLRQLEDADPRVFVIRSTQQRGANYVRNVAVSQYSHGDFVTVHGDRGWSHADRITSQVSHLLESNELGCVCRKASLTDDGKFTRTGSTVAYFSIAPDSVVLRRSAFQQIGFWRPAPVNSDEDFCSRLQDAQQRPLHTLGSAHLVLSRISEEPLFSSDSMRGFKVAKLRWCDWLARCEDEGNKRNGRTTYVGTGVASHAGIPHNASVTSTSRASFDRVIAAHWGEENPEIDAAVDLARQLLATGHSVGLLHVDSPLYGAAQGVSQAVADLVDGGAIPVAVEDDILVEQTIVLEPLGCWLSKSRNPQLRSNRIQCDCRVDTGDCLVQWRSGSSDDNE